MLKTETGISSDPDEPHGSGNSSTVSRLYLLIGMLSKKKRFEKIEQWKVRT